MGGSEAHLHPLVWPSFYTSNELRLLWMGLAASHHFSKKAPQHRTSTGTAGSPELAKASANTSSRGVEIDPCGRAVRAFASRGGGA